MAGSTPASPTVDAAVVALRGKARSRQVTPWTEAWRRFRRHRLAVASAVVLLAMILAVAFGPLLWRVQINDIDFTAQLQGPSWAHPLGTDDLGQDLLARMLYGGRISLAVGLAAMSVSVVVGTIVGAIAGISRGSVDAALMWLIDLFLSLPQLPVLLLLIYLFRDSLKALVGPELGIFILDRRGDRRVSLDDRGPAGARAVLRAAREGVRRGGARSRRLDVPPGGAPHPAERAWPGDRRRHDRRGRGDHRGIDAVVSRSRLSAGHPDLGPHPVRREGSISTSHRTGHCSPAARSSSRCSPSTSSATGCAMRSIRAASCSVDAACDGQKLTFTAEFAAIAARPWIDEHAPMRRLRRSPAG